MKKRVHQIITDRILEIMAEGVIPWQRPWQGDGSGSRPVNMSSMRPYSGVNVLLLGSAPYGSRYWLTFNQIRAKGGKVLKGSKGWPVFFWKPIEVENENKKTGEKEEKLIWIEKYFTVFNLEQTEGIEAPAEDVKPGFEHDPIELAESVIANMPQAPTIDHGGDRAFYAPSLDKVHLPHFEQFKQAEQYYNVAFHELAHSTGHASRLNRKGIIESAGFGSEKYSKEELVAEMTAAFLCGSIGIEQKTINNSAAYLQGWMEKIKDDPRLIIHAAGAAEKAAEFISPQVEEEAPTTQEQAAA